MKAKAMDGLMDSVTGLMRMGDLSRQAGISRQTLSHYLLLGLIQETERTPSERCLFSPSVLARLEDIAVMKRQGRTLREIRENLARPTTLAVHSARKSRA